MATNRVMTGERLFGTPVEEWLGRLTSADSYLVLGVELRPASVRSDCGVFFDIGIDSGYVLGFPAELFTIVDPRVSQEWEVRLPPDGGLTIWPPEFYEPYFHDRLSDGDAETVRLYRQLRRRLEQEFGLGPAEGGK